MAQRYFGQPIRRTEDVRLTMGNGKYLDDIGVGQPALEAAFLRSPFANARIKSIDIDAALEI